MKSLLSVQVLSGEKKQRAPSPLHSHAAHIYIYPCLCSTCKQTCIACDCWGNGVKNRSGVAGSGCGFRSDEIQKPAAFGITPVLPVPLAWRPGGKRGSGGKWMESYNAPCPTGSSASTQPAAPTLHILPVGPEPQPDPTAVCFTTLNHSWPKNPQYSNQALHFHSFSSSLFYIFIP